MVSRIRFSSQSKGSPPVNGSIIIKIAIGNESPLTESKAEDIFGKQALLIRDNNRNVWTATVNWMFGDSCWFQRGSEQGDSDWAWRAKHDRRVRCQFTFPWTVHAIWTRALANENSRECWNSRSKRHHIVLSCRLFSLSRWGQLNAGSFVWVMWMMKWLVLNKTSNGLGWRVPSITPWKDQCLIRSYGEQRQFG